jgi:hypothetical protein
MFPWGTRAFPRENTFFFREGALLLKKLGTFFKENPLLPKEIVFSLRELFLLCIQVIFWDISFVPERIF